MENDDESLLDNPSFDKIEEPVSLYFSYVDKDKYTYFKRHKKELVNIYNECQQRLIQPTKS